MWGGGESGRRFFSEKHWRGPLGWNEESRVFGRSKRGGSRDEKIRVFCASMADVFEDREDLYWPRARLFALIMATPHLDWQVLTKRPEFARDTLARHSFWEGVGIAAGEHYPDLRWDFGYEIGDRPNLWIGTSIENARFTWRADVLREIPAAVRFLSCEPLLGSLFDRGSRGSGARAGTTDPQPEQGWAPAPRSKPMRDRKQPTDIPQQGSIESPGKESAWPSTSQVSPGVSRRDSASTASDHGSARAPLNLDGIDWVIVGGESGGRRSRPMHPDWVREIRDACIDRDIPLFLKQWGSWGPVPETGGLRLGDICWSLGPGGMRYVLDRDYVCAPNESDGEWLRYFGPGPKSGGKELDGVEWCQIPGDTVLA